MPIKIGIGRKTDMYGKIALEVTCMQNARKWLCSESWALLLICTADLLTTLVFVQNGWAEEGNPVMRFYLEQSVFAFILAKAVLVIAPLMIIEWGRRHRPQTVRFLARTAVIGYLGIYGTLFYQTNMPAMTATAAPTVIQLPGTSSDPKANFEYYYRSPDVYDSSWGSRK